MIRRFREATTITEGYLIKQGQPIPIVIPAHTNLVHFLRLMYIEHKSGKLYVPRQMSVYSKDYYSNWSLIMWGGGRHKTGKIKCVEVRKGNVPKTLELIELIGG